MLEVKCPDYLAEVRKFAVEKGILPDLEKNLKILDEMYAPDGICELRQDFAEHSFLFTIHTRVFITDASQAKQPGITYDEATKSYRKFRLCGGLIFYAGAESGVTGQFSVTNSGRKDSRWEIHT